MTILERIIIHKRQELADSRTKRPVKVLEKNNLFNRTTLPLTTSILSTNKTGIIAEFKRKSPSRGIINNQAILEEVTTGYFRFGASGLSILTDQKFFGGSVDDLIRTRELNPIPILRKDFIIDEYQIIESKAIGADAILLIASILETGQTYNLARFARSLDLQVLLEVHRLVELHHLNEFVSMVGVNNRDLNTFIVDTDLSIQLADSIPSDFVKISESGINSPMTIKKLRKSGYQGFLIGESFMLAPEPATAFSDFVKLLMFEND
jgi:indole-3-glycerol phosphate synthase